MLVLMRKVQEWVVMGGSAGFSTFESPKVLDIKGEKVKLGFDIDPDVPVHGLEVWERICAARQLPDVTAVIAPPPK